MDYSVPSVETAIKLLDYLKENAPAQKSLAEACAALGIPRTTAFSVLKTMEKHHLVRFDAETKRYRLGWALVGLGAKAAEHMDWVEVVRPYLQAFVRDTKLTCFLVQRAEDQLMLVDRADPSSNIRIVASIGEFFPLSTGALGKALMAYLKDEEVSSYIARKGLRAFTQHSITNVETLRENLAEVRRRGFAKSIEEYARGINVVAAPIFDPAGEAILVMAGLGLASPLSPECIDEFGSKVLKAAYQATQALGGRWPVTP
ncbi:MAG: IclR family transcriptional regulator [Chloroflexi bacterium]|nr:IclR family transcriptional regulator [Chloroflexota bacterium]